MKKAILLLTVATVISACATQRYGRVTELSATEKAEFNCRDLRIETAKTEEFMSSVRMQRRDMSGAHVLGFLGDFGIGNSIEGDAAELSGEKRLRELKALAVAKKCK